MENLIWDVIIQPIDPLISSRGTSWGGFALGYNHWLTRHVGLGGTFAFSSDQITEQRKITGEWIFDMTYVSLMVTVKVNYVTTPWVDVYARSDVGGTIIAATQTNAGTTDDYAAFIFAGQFSPIGFRVGKTFNFFVEAGFGTIGLVNAGFNIKF
jgi:opacity protein-like surface antigen